MNITLFQNVTNIAEVGAGLNIATHFLLADFILLGFFIIAIAIFSTRYDFKEVFIGVSSASILIALLLWAIKWLPIEHIWYPIVLFIASLITYMVSK